MRDYKKKVRRARIFSDKDKVELVGYDISQVAALFGVGESTIYRWMNKLESFPKGVKAPGGRIWSANSLRYYLDQCEPTQKSLRAAARMTRLQRGVA